MSSALFGKNNNKRITALRSYNILDSIEEKDYDDLTALAATICGVPIALISLVDEKRQWFKSHHGIPVVETPVEQSFCAHAIVSTEDITVIEDARQDNRVKDNPLVTGSPYITFYAGVPLINEEGYGLGTLCVIDPEKRSLSKEQKSALKIIARQVMDKMELRRKLIELETKNKLLHHSEKKVKKLNSELNLSGARNKLFIQQAPVAIIIFKGIDLVIEEVNASMLGLMGKQYDILNKPLLQAVPELKGQPAYELLHKVFTTGEAYYGRDVAVVLNKNGKAETGYYNFTYLPLIEDEKITGILDTAVDVTEQVEARKAEKRMNEELHAINEELKISNEKQVTTNKELSLKNDELEGLQQTLNKAFTGITESEKRFRTMAEGTNILITVGDESGHIVYFNKAWYDITGRSVEALLELGWMDFVNPEDKEKYLNIFNNSFKNSSPFSCEFRLLNKEGNYQWMLTTGQPRLNADGSFAGYICSCIDITEQKKDEQRKNDFISIVSHELKTPLTSLKGNIQILQMITEAGSDKFLKDGLERADNQVNKMNVLINGFLNVSRLESGKIHIDMQRFDMANLVKEAEEEIKATIVSHNIIFAPVEETFVYADRDKIGQVINNFISNAAKYSVAGSTINVACVTIKNNATISVKDEGIGILQKDTGKIFDRFYRVESKQTTTISGFGIGLYLSAEIIYRHHGKIWVESEPGKGSVFYFSIPTIMASTSFPQLML